MIPFSTIFWMGVIAASAFGLYMVKYQVKAIQEELAETNQQIRDEQQALHVVKAEWAYMTRPERLNELAAKHLVLVPMKGEQLADVEQLPKPGENIADAGAPEDGVSPVSLKVTPALLEGNGDDQ